jgi:hypothetical protein
MADLIKLLALRIENVSKHCLLTWKFKGGALGLPMKSLEDDNVLDDIDKLLNMICGHFEVVSATEIVNYEDKDDEGAEYHSVIYDIKYSGTILPTMTNCPEATHKSSCWMPKVALRNGHSITYPTFAYLEAEKDLCG